MAKITYFWIYMLLAIGVFLVIFQILKWYSLITAFTFFVFFHYFLLLLSHILNNAYKRAKFEKKNGILLFLIFSIDFIKFFISVLIFTLLKIY